MKVTLHLTDDLLRDPPEGFLPGWPRYMNVLNPTAVPVGAVVKDLCVRAGLDENHVDVSDLMEEELDGYIIAKQDTVKNCIAPLCQAFFFDGVESSAEYCVGMEPTNCTPVTVFHDSFTGANGTLLTAHVPDTAPEGFAWAHADDIYPDMVGQLQDGKLTANPPNVGLGFDSQNGADLALTLTFPFTVEMTVTLVDTGDVGLSGEMWLDLSTPATWQQVYIDLVLYDDPPALFVSVGDGYDSGAPISVGTHLISVFVEETQFTVSIDGVARDPVPSTLVPTFSHLRLANYEESADHHFSIDDIKITQECP